MGGRTQLIGVPVGGFLAVLYLFSIFFAKPLTTLTLAQVWKLSGKNTLGGARTFFANLLI